MEENSNVNDHHGQHSEAVGCGEVIREMTEMHSYLSDTLRVHLPSRLGFDERSMGALTIKDTAEDKTVGWAMHFSQRSELLGRILVDEQGRVSRGRQKVWQGMLEADLRVQVWEMPHNLEGLAGEECSELTATLQDIQNTKCLGLNRAGAIAQKTLKT